MIVYVSVAIALVAFVVYALDRKARNEPIVWLDAGKLALFGAILSAGVVFAVSSDTAPIVAEVVKEVADEMFVGTATF